MLIDAGPLVALIDRSDPYHEDCREVFRSLDEPPATVWPAFTEALYLLRSSARAQLALWEMIEHGAVMFMPLSHNDLPRMRELMWKYRDLPMDLADAALVRVAEREKLRQIITIGRRDFEIYRPQRIGKFRILP